MPKLLELVPESDSLLRQKCRRLTPAEIKSPEVQSLINDLKYTSQQKAMGVGLSANQCGQSEAISIITIKPTPARPNLQPFEKVCINTEITETFGEKEPMWEGCQSTARDENGEPMMAPVPRYKRIQIKYFDQNGDEQEEIVEDFVAHVVQHETDHLNGILFTDLIDTSTMIPYQKFIELSRKNLL